MTTRILAGDPDRAGYIWIDLEAPTAEEIADVRARLGISADLRPDPVRGLHPALLVEPDHCLLILAGDGVRDDLVEVRCYSGPDWTVTVHEDGCPSIAALTGAAGAPDEAVEVVARRLVTGLVDVVRALDDEVESIEASSNDARPVKRRLSAVRRTVLAQRDVLARLANGEGLQDARHPRRASLRNSAERMGQIGGEVEILREALHDAMTDRQNEVVARLTLIAAVLLPLTFLTGFFGQNFPWMVEHVGGAGWFVALGLVLPVVVVAGLLLALRHRGWL